MPRDTHDTRPRLAAAVASAEIAAEEVEIATAAGRAMRLWALPRARHAPDGKRSPAFKPRTPAFEHQPPAFVPSPLASAIATPALGVPTFAFEVPTLAFGTPTLAADGMTPASAHPTPAVDAETPAFEARVRRTCRKAAGLARVYAQPVVRERSMQQFKRIVFIIVWTLAAFWGWLFTWSLAVRLVTDSSRDAIATLLHGLPEWLAILLLPGLILGTTFIVTIGTLLLGMRGKLPGTWKSQLPRRGFEVEIKTP